MPIKLRSPYIDLRGYFNGLQSGSYRLSVSGMTLDPTQSPIQVSKYDGVDSAVLESSDGMIARTLVFPGSGNHTISLHRGQSLIQSLDVDIEPLRSEVVTLETDLDRHGSRFGLPRLPGEPDGKYKIRIESYSQLAGSLNPRDVTAALLLRCGFPLPRRVGFIVTTLRNPVCNIGASSISMGSTDLFLQTRLLKGENNLSNLLPNNSRITYADTQGSGTVQVTGDRSVWCSEADALSSITYEIHATWDRPTSTLGEVLGKVASVCDHSSPTVGGWVCKLGNTRFLSSTSSPCTNACCQYYKPQATLPVWAYATSSPSFQQSTDPTRPLIVRFPQDDNRKRPADLLVRGRPSEIKWCNYTRFVLETADMTIASLSDPDLLSRLVGGKLPVSFDSIRSSIESQLPFIYGNATERFGYFADEGSYRINTASPLRMDVEDGPRLAGVSVDPDSLKPSGGPDDSIAVSPGPFLDKNGTWHYLCGHKRTCYLQDIAYLKFKPWEVPLRNGLEPGEYDLCPPETLFSTTVGEETFEAIPQDTNKFRLTIPAQVDENGMSEVIVEDDGVEIDGVLTDPFNVRTDTIVASGSDVTITYTSAYKITGPCKYTLRDAQIDGIPVKKELRYSEDGSVWIPACGSVLTGNLSYEIWGNTVIVPISVPTQYLEPIYLLPSTPIGPVVVSDTEIDPYSEEDPVIALCPPGRFLVEGRYLKFLGGTPLPFVSGADDTYQAVLTKDAISSNPTILRFIWSGNDAINVEFPDSGETHILSSKRSVTISNVVYHYGYIRHPLSRTLNYPFSVKATGVHKVWGSIGGESSESWRPEFGDTETICAPQWGIVPNLKIEYDSGGTYYVPDSILSGYNDKVLCLSVDTSEDSPIIRLEGRDLWQSGYSEDDFPCRLLPEEETDDSLKIEWDPILSDPNNRISVIRGIVTRQNGSIDGITLNVLASNGLLVSANSQSGESIQVSPDNNGTVYITVSPKNEFFYTVINSDGSVVMYDTEGNVLTDDIRFFPKSFITNAWVAAMPNGGYRQPSQLPVNSSIYGMQAPLIIPSIDTEKETEHAVSLSSKTMTVMLSDMDAIPYTVCVYVVDSNGSNRKVFHQTLEDTIRTNQFTHFGDVVTLSTDGLSSTDTVQVTYKVPLVITDTDGRPSLTPRASSLVGKLLWIPSPVIGNVFIGTSEDFRSNMQITLSSPEEPDEVLQPFAGTPIVHNSDGNPEPLKNAGDAGILGYHWITSEAESSPEKIEWEVFSCVGHANETQVTGPSQSGFIYPSATSGSSIITTLLLDPTDSSLATKAAWTSNVPSSEENTGGGLADGSLIHMRCVMQNGKVRTAVATYPPSTGIGPSYITPIDVSVYPATNCSMETPVIVEIPESWEQIKVTHVSGIGLCQDGSYCAGAVLVLEEDGIQTHIEKIGILGTSGESAPLSINEASSNVADPIILKKSPGSLYCNLLLFIPRGTEAPETLEDDAILFRVEPYAGGDPSWT